MAIQGWNYMGGAIDWNALQVIVELLDVDDVDGFVAGLIGIRSACGER